MWVKNKEDVTARLRRGMMIFLKGVILEGQDDEIEEVENSFGRMKLVECRGDMGVLMEGMKKMNLGGEG